MAGDGAGWQWGRRLLALSGSMAENSAAPEAGQEVLLVLLALVLTVLLLLLLLLCVCRESSSSAELKIVQPRQNSTNNFHGAACRPDEVALEMMPLAPAENGTPGSGNSLAATSSHSRQASSGSATLRPTSLRELPSPPTSATRPQSSDHGGVSSHLSSPMGRDDGDDYDHLNQRRRDKQVAANYDHITLPGEGESAAQSREESRESPAENYYAQVPDRTYDVVTEPSASELDHYTLVQDKESTYSEVKDKGGPYPQAKDTGYAKVKDDGYTKVKDSGYAKVKDNVYSQVKPSFTGGGDQTFDKSLTEASPWLREDDYSKVSDGSDPYAKVKDTDDPYNKVVEDSRACLGADEDDTYCRVKDDDPYMGMQDGESGGDGVVVAGGTEGLAEAEDPYSTVGDDAAQTQVKMVSVIRVQSRSHVVTERHCSITTSSASTVVSSLDSLSRAQQRGAHCNPSDDYAVVNKQRTPIPEGQKEGGEEEEEDTRARAPPEPPRGYLGSSISQPPTFPPPVVVAASDSEHNYNKVTVRESLASMSARNALNPYELVADVENMYATVEGGSGDGVVVRQHQQAAALHSQPSETYEEIGATAGLVSGAAAPVPPSVDSLHLITQQHQEERGHRNCSSPEDSLHPRSDTQPPSGKARSFSPTALPQLPMEHLLPGAATANGAVEDEDEQVTLDPNYHRVKDRVVPEVENEYDPNYESVEEARARGPPNWRRPPHVYEEVPLPQASPAWAPRPGPSQGHTRSRSDEASTVKERVLQSHTYEVITDVKNRHRKSDGGGK